MKNKLFQKQDMARAALHDGLILSWDTGLGKSIAAYEWPLLKVGFEKVGAHVKPKKPVLLIAPGDLHQQLMEEGLSKFKVKTVPIPDQATFTQLSRRPGTLMPNLTEEGKPIIPPDFYITSYTQLATNGVQSLPDPADWPDPMALLRFLCLPLGKHQNTVNNGDTVTVHPDKPPQAIYGWMDRPSFTSVCQFFAWRGLCWSDEYHQLNLHPDDDLDDLSKAYEREMEACNSMRDPRLAASMRAKVQQAHDTLRNLFTKNPCPKYEQLSQPQQDFVVREFCGLKVEEYSRNNGQFKPPEKERPNYGLIDEAEDEHVEGETEESGQATPAKLTPPRIKCCYSPSLADLSYNAFECVVIDEGVKMKGEDTWVGKGVRSMEPKYRLILTATPVKNRLPDIFRLAWWAAGGLPDAHARWPYADDTSERTKFAETFMVSERNLTKEAKAEANGERVTSSRYKKLTAEVCNVHRLWKLLGPIVLRRRKQDAGEEIVPRLRKVIRCDLGTLQQQVYQYHLQADYRDKNGEKAIGAQLQALRMVAADPASEHLRTVDGTNTRTCPECKGKHLVSGALDKPGSGEAALNAAATPVCTKCQGSGSIPLPHRSGNAYIPKMASTLTLIQEILARREQVVVFSAFNDPLDNLGRWLDEASVRYVKLDGRVSQKQRGKLANQFKKGRVKQLNSKDQPIPVMLAGVECMAEGHSFHLANNVILIAYSWAFDKFKQALDRVHRMNSEKPVNVYVVLCSGTIDRKLESLIQDKGDAAELVLDGRLIGERTEEVNLAELLKVAHR